MACFDLLFYSYFKPEKCNLADKRNSLPTHIVVYLPLFLYLSLLLVLKLTPTINITGYSNLTTSCAIQN